MKNFVKLIPVALGLLTLASCSNDELLGEKAFDATQLQEGEMLVDLEEPSEYGDGFTRSYTDRTMKKHRWTETIDQLQVYGKAFGAYDLYAFSWKVSNGSTIGVFKRQHQVSNIDDAKWALFPLKSINHGEWHMIDHYNNYTEVNINLPEFIEYKAAYDLPNYQTGADLDPYYLDELPRFGEVADVEDGEAVHTKLNYMTGILRLQLAGIPAYATGVKIQMYENANRTQPLVLNGDFTTRIGLNNTIVEGAALACDKADATIPAGSPYAMDEDEDGAIYVYLPPQTALNGKDAKKGVLYIPLPVWDTESAIVISTSQDYEGENGTVDHAAATWTEYKELSKKPIQRGKVYGNKNEYNLALDGTGPGAISDALDLVETDEETITIVANEEIEVCSTGNATTIQIPNKPGVKNIIIDLSNGLFACQPDETLKIVYASDADPFLGNVTLIAGEPTVNTAEAVALDVNLPKSGFAIVAAQALAGDLTNVINQAAGKIDIDAEEFVVGNADKYTPTYLDVQALKFSTNVKTFTVAQEGRLDGDFAIDQQTNPKPEDWTFGAVETINISGAVNGTIDAASDVKPTYKVAVNVTGGQIENSAFGFVAPSISGDILTNGTVTINAGDYVKALSPDNKTATINGEIKAEDAITVQGHASISGDVWSTKATVALKGHVSVTGDVTADQNIDITEQAYTAGDIKSNNGNITIDNNYTELAYVSTPMFSGAIEATKGSVSLNQAVNKESGKYIVSEFGGDITAGTDFTMTGLTKTTGAIQLSGTATIDVAPQEGNCVAVNGGLTYTLGDNFQLNLLQGYVAGLDATEGPVKLNFASTAAYAALVGVIEEKNVLPQNESIWNGDYEIEKYAAFGTDGWNIDNNRIWTATQLGYQMTSPTDDIELRSNFNLDNQEWPGIDAPDNTKFTGLLDSKKKEAYYQYKTIKNVNLTNPESQKTAGFFATAGTGLEVSNVKFENVKTTFDMVSTSGTPKTNMVGVGAVLGKGAGTADFTRVSVTLAGEKFGSDGTVNKKSAFIGGVAGWTLAAATFKGVTFDGQSTSLCGWYNLGGLIGRCGGSFTVGMADALNKMTAVQTTVDNVNVVVSFVDNATVNDLYQGMTGLFAGSVKENITITDVDDALVNAPFAPTGAKDRGLDNKAFKITSGTARYFFNRADQTLVGHDGEYEDNNKDYFINDVQYQIYQEGSVSGNYSPGKKHFYDLTLEPHQD